MGNDSPPHSIPNLHFNLQIKMLKRKSRSEMGLLNTLQRSYLTNLDSSEVLKILRWSGEDNKVYFLATAKGQPNSQHLFRVAVDQTGSAPECMSCKHSDNENYK